MKVIKPTTLSIDVQHKLVSALKEHTYLIKGSFFRPAKLQDVIVYLKELSEAEAKLWEIVRRTYPEAIGKANLTTSATEVSWDEPDETEQITE